MRRVSSCLLPTEALLTKYADQDNGAYTDCFTAVLEAEVSHAAYIRAFYCGGVFKLERLILQLLLAKPSTDAEVKALAEGSIDEFAAWRVEARAENQLLLCDYAGRTRSWLMSLPVRTQAGAHTRLYFGSAVVPRQRHQTGKPGLGMAFNLLLGFHKLYSRVLLAAARKRLGRMGLR